MHNVEMEITKSRRRPGLVGVVAILLLASACSRGFDDPSMVNRDAASRCVHSIDAWKKKVVEIEALHKQFDAACNEVRASYAKATPEEKQKLRDKLADLSWQTDEASRAADQQFLEVMRELEFVPRDKGARAKLAMLTTPLRDTEGARTPEVERALDAVSTQLQVLLKVD